MLAGGSLAGKRLGPCPPISNHPALLADGSGLALDHISSRLTRQTSIEAMLVVVDAPLPPLRPIRKQHAWQWLPIPPQPSVLASLDAALARVNSEQVLVQPITTLPPDPLPNGSWIGLGEQPLPREDWSAVSALGTKHPRFHHKRDPIDQQAPECHPFTGLIQAPAALLRELLGQRRDHPSWSAEADQDLLSLAEWLHARHAARLETMPWLDLGHRATASRRRLSRLSSRGFNSVRYCRDGDLIEKHSQNQQRLAQEAAYFSALPQPLQRFFPACLHHQPGRLDLEYVPFPSAAELFLHWRIGPNGWLQLMERLAGIREALACEATSTPSPKADVRWLYSQKLLQRLQQLNAQPPLLPGEHGWNTWWVTPWTLELSASKPGQPMQQISLPAPQTAVATLAQHLPALERERPLQRIHGDLCFNNILAEPLSGSIRLIDPRGETPEGASWPIGFGDPRYDQVKLLHSGRYLYDVVVNDLFELELIAPAHLRLRLDVPDHYADVQQAMERSGLLHSLTQNEEQWLTASLFFSMLPLHREDGERCLAFVAIGLMILSNRFSAVLQ